jgi:hypothetical protein
MHLLGHMTKRWNFSDPVEILERSNTPHLCDSRHRRSPCPDNSLAQIMLHRNISFGEAENTDMAAA